MNLASLDPLPSSQWDFWKAAHLLNRAGFGGPVDAVEALHSLGPEQAVDALLEEKGASYPPPQWAVPENLDVRRRAERGLSEEERRDRRMARNREERRCYLEFVGWWLERMRQSEDAATEKLTLFWHGHFATSQAKVRPPYYLWLQNETLRAGAMGDFRALVKAVTRDPAMLIYLDGDSSRSGSPNENFAREVMELFTLGEGHYTERDVAEAARAFTGYRINPADQSSRFARLQHDDGVKTLFGKSGRFTGEEAIDLIVSQRACAPFLSRKLLGYYVMEHPSEPLVAAFAEELLRQRFHLRPALRTLFRSAAFYAPEAVQIKGPVEWLVGTARRLGGRLPPYNVSYNMLSQLGQIPYQPPNVKGWDGGKSWISTSTLLARYNHAAVLCGAEPIRPGRQGGGRKGAGRLRPTLLIGLPEAVRASPDATVDAFAKALFSQPLPAEERAPFVQFLHGREGGDDPLLLARLLHLMMSTPRFQLS